MITTLSRLTFAFAVSVGLAGSMQAQSFNDLAYNSPVNPENSLPTSDPLYEANSHDCRWTGQAIGPSYGGSTWTGFAALDLRDYLFSGGQQTWGRCFRGGRAEGTVPSAVTAAQSLTGYQQQYSAYNANATNVVAIGGEWGQIRRAAPFTLQSMLLGAGWGNVSSLRLTGWLAGNLVWDASFSFLGTGGNFSNYSNSAWVDQIQFNATYATESAEDPYNTKGEQAGYTIGSISPRQPSDFSPYRTFFVDNVVLATVPEPGTFGLVAFGLAGLAGVARRRRSAK